jgi:hypothetical protein
MGIRRTLNSPVLGPGFLAKEREREREGKFTELKMGSKVFSWL